MDSFYEFFLHLLDPEKLILLGGVSLILFIIFAENGIFFCFFFPGDSLLFTTGILCATGHIEMQVFLLSTLIAISAILGNMVGYVFGKRVGGALYNKKDTLLFKKKYILTAEFFFQKHGGAALILGRFLPIIRTFAPIFAGIVHMDFKKFMGYNVVGGIVWVFGLVVGGFYTAQLFPGISDYLEYFIIGIVIVTWIPVIRTYLVERKKQLAKESKKEEE
jgi:membrane-associated protein